MQQSFPTRIPETEFVTRLAQHLSYVGITMLALSLATLLLINSGCGASRGASSAASSSAQNISITLSPSRATLQPGATQLFSAGISNSPNTSVTWSATSGTISAQGLFSAPASKTVATVMVTATSVADTTVKATALVTVASAGPPRLLITTSSMPAATNGTAYSASIPATGGVPPYQWTLSSGSLPSGLQLDHSTGLVSGTTTQTGSYPLTADVTDSAGHAATQNLVVQVSSSLQYSGKDGPAQLPLVYLHTAVANTPSPGTTVTVNAGGDLQDALNSAACGDVIELQAGATFTTNLTLPAKSCDNAHWITVRTSASDASLPAEGTRITPCYAGVTSLHGLSLNCISTTHVMAKIVGFPPVATAIGASYYRLIGLELTQTAGVSAYSIVDIADTSTYIYVDRCWVHGTATDNSQLGVRFNSADLALVDSFVSDIHYVETDSQAVGGAAGTGPYKITNNYLEAAGENIMFGGSAATTTPADIEIRYNYLYKPLIWMIGNPAYAGIHWTVKDLFELKNGQRILLEGNIFENMWGSPIVITPKNQENQCPICIASDLTFRFNIVRHAAVAFSIADEPSAAKGLAQSSQFISLHDDLFDDINRIEWSGSTGGSWMFYLGACSYCQPIHDVAMTHLTVISANQAFMLLDFISTNPVQNLSYTNNIQQNGMYGIDGCGTALVTWSTCATGTTFNENVIVGGSAANYSGTNSFPSNWSAVDFTNYNNGDDGNYLLLSNSPYANPSVYGGAGAGADIATLNTITASVSQW